MFFEYMQPMAPPAALCWTDHHPTADLWEPARPKPKGHHRFLPCLLVPHLASNSFLKKKLLFYFKIFGKTCIT